MNKEKPIIFSTPMIKAILEGRKTQTRRVIKLPKEAPQGRVPFYKDIPDPTLGVHAFWEVKPKYERGDILWVKETWADIAETTPGNFHYKSCATEGDIEWFKENNWKWKSAMFMPRKAARIFLEVKSVRVERSQEITGRDVLAEGIDNGHSNPKMGLRWENMQRMAFSELWDSINAKRGYSWKSDPWVWVIEFGRIET